MCVLLRLLLRFTRLFFVFVVVVVIVITIVKNGDLSVDDLLVIITVIMCQVNYRARCCLGLKLRVIYAFVREDLSID